MNICSRNGLLTIWPQIITLFEVLVKHMSSLVCNELMVRNYWFTDNLRNMNKWDSWQNTDNFIQDTIENYQLGFTLFSPGRCGSDLKSVIFKLILQINI